jgi:hypothetical protein
MSFSETLHRVRPVKARLAMTLVGLGAAAAISGHPDLVLPLCGVALVWVAALVGSSLTRRAVDERDPGRMLVWDALLVGVVVLGLIGVVMITAPWS